MGVGVNQLLFADVLVNGSEEKWSVSVRELGSVCERRSRKVNMGEVKYWN